MQRLSAVEEVESQRLSMVVEDLVPVVGSGGGGTAVGNGCGGG